VESEDALAEDPEDPEVTAVLPADEDVPRQEHLCPGASSLPQ